MPKFPTRSCAISSRSSCSTWTRSVYHSDLKKLCTWYNALAELSLLPFSDEEAGEAAPAAEEAAEESR